MDETDILPFFRSWWKRDLKVRFIQTTCGENEDFGESEKMTSKTRFKHVL